jgi:XTP/dITP diphosphohydrolase
VIIDTPRGSGGFGYDPVFYLPAFGRTMAELSFAEKNAISHRALAARGVAETLRLRVYGHQP